MGLFDSIGNIASTLLTNKSNRENVKDTNEANAALWREQSAYNTPGKQMERLQAAGLNPNLAYGQIAESRASNPPTMAAPHAESPNISLDESISQYQQIKNMQTLNARQTIDVETAKANAIKAASDADYSVWENSQLKNSGTLKSDPALIKEVRRGLSGLGDFVGGVFRRTEKASREATKNMLPPLIKYVGPDEAAHAALGEQFDGGQ